MLFVVYLYIIENQMFINYFSLEMKVFCLFICVYQNIAISLHCQVKITAT